jgi:uncharacterized protein with HEPN domain
VSARPLQQRLRDALEAIVAIRRHEATAKDHGLGRDDPLVLDAVVRQLAIIGEAVAALPESVAEQRKDIPWSDIAGMRILLDHHYHRVDADTVWNTVDDDLEPLEQAVKGILDA